MHVHPVPWSIRQAQIAQAVRIGPFCVIGEHVVLGAGCRLHSHVVLTATRGWGADNETLSVRHHRLRHKDLKWRVGTTFTEIGDDNTLS